MAEFVVERYLARGDTVGLEDNVRRARQVAELLGDDGTAIRYLHSIFIPEDETCLLFYEAGSRGALEAAVTRAELPWDRITEAVAER